MNTRSGCSQFPTFWQILAYVLYILIAIMTYIHALILDENLVHLIFFSFLILLSCYFSIKTTLIDPTDNYVIQQQNYRGESIDYEEHQLTQFCGVCMAYVKETTKHCQQCNRCCQDFDHHCRWINNCVGGKNYKQFIGMIVFIFLFLLYSMIVNGRVINQYNKQEIKNLTIYSQQQKYMFIMAIVLLVLQIVASIFLLQLIIFHAYLYKKGISTYEYITQKSINQEQPSNSFEFNIINNQDSIFKKNKVQENQSIILKKEKEKQSSQVYTNSGMIKKDESIWSLKKNSQVRLKKQNFTLGESEDFEKENVVHFHSERNLQNVDSIQQNNQLNTIDVKKPEIIQFE